MRDYKVVDGKKQFYFKNADPSEAWIDGESDNQFKFIKRKKDGVIELHIKSHNKQRYIISFLCEDIDIVNTKLVGYDNMSDYISKIVNDNSSIIHSDTQKTVNENKLSDYAIINAALSNSNGKKITLNEFFSSYYFHDCNILDMHLCGDELTIIFILWMKYNVDKYLDYEGGYYYLKVKCLNISNLAAKKLSKIKVKGKIAKGQKDYTEEECSLEEAWLDGKQNDFEVIDQEGDNGILLYITAIDNSDTYIISFNCEDVQIIDEKLITDEELDKLYDEIENDDSPRIS
jgi:hypothetical protein